MAERVASISGKDLSESVDLWANEIRAYLLGRLSAMARIEGLEQAEHTELTHPPILRWWIFEGKHYTSLGGPLVPNWDSVVASAQRLEQTFNPRFRLDDRPDGVVDWAQTLARGPRQLHSPFIVRSSGIGLDEDERAALRGWAGWIAQEWCEYARRNGVDERLNWRGFQFDPGGAVGIDRLRRWAHTARRSRWTLLRDVVAESLRPVLEPIDLNRIPLPADAPTLFELLCLVRIAQMLAPLPGELRWMDYEMTNNVLRLEGVQCVFQQSLGREAVLETSLYDGSLATAARVFGVRVPHILDIAFDFDATRAGFDGIIVEAKSGSQQYGAAVEQLRIYRAARPRVQRSRFLIWGIVETTDGPDATSAQVRRVLADSPPGEDVWVFSSADAIPCVLRAVFGEPVLGNATLYLTAGSSPAGDAG